MIPFIINVQTRHIKVASQVGLVVKNPPANAEDLRVVVLTPGCGTSPGGRNGIPVLLPGESHGQRSLQSIELQRVRTEVMLHTGISRHMSD